MKIMNFFLAVLAAASHLSLHAQVGRSDDDYALGRKVGACLVTKCQVFTGWLDSDRPASDQAVRMRLETQLFGPRINSDVVTLPFADPNLKLGPPRSPNQAWANVQSARNTYVTAVLALERIRSSAPGDPVLLTSDPHAQDTVRSLATEATRLQSSPDAIGVSVGSLSQAPNRALAGYLYEYLTNLETLETIELFASLLAQMMGNPGVPSDTWDSIGQNLVVEYHRLSPSGRAGVVLRFSELGQSADLPAARAGLLGLSRLAAFYASIKSTISPSAIAKLARAYGAIRDSVPLAYDAALSQLLNIKPR
jgi:hypothetical protein